MSLEQGLIDSVVNAVKSVCDKDETLSPQITLAAFICHIVGSEEGLTPHCYITTKKR